MFSWFLRAKPPTSDRQLSSAKPTGTDQTAPNVPANLGDLNGDDLWTRAMNAAIRGAQNDAMRFFAAAIRKDPWKYCGVGAGSWRPANGHQQVPWLDGMAEAGFGEVATALQNQPPVAATLSATQSADQELENLVKRTCARLGIVRDPRADASQVKNSRAAASADSLGQEPGAGVPPQSMSCFSSGEIGLMMTEQAYFKGLSGAAGETTAVQLIAILEGTDTANEYWKLANITEALSLLGQAAAPAADVLRSPKYIKDERDAVRFCVVDVFAAMGPGASAAITELREAAGDKYAAVSDRAKEALKNIQDAR